MKAFVVSDNHDSVVGMVLAFGLSELPAGPALLLSAAVFLALPLHNFSSHRPHGLAMNLA